MSYPLKVIAPAKINLYLDIVGVRDDGYHLLETVMQSVSLADEIAISPNTEGKIKLSCNRNDLPLNEDNIVYRTAELFCEQYGVDKGISLHITKNIPMCAGLGGGSADGAAVLTGLNEFFGVSAPVSELCTLGASIGADIPFCITGGTAEVAGIGEFINPIPSLPDCYIVIAKPSEGISTKLAFQRYDNQSGVSLPNNKMSDLMGSIVAGDIHSISNELYNVFSSLHDSVDVCTILELMRMNGALGCLLSGSGSACFAIFNDKSSAKRCYRRLKDVSQSVFITHPCKHGAIVI